jgi:hypothetical protein
MSLYINRFFKHKIDYSNVVVANMEKGSDGGYHLFINLVDGDEIKGMPGSRKIMLSTDQYHDNWKELLEEYMWNNQYEDYNPHVMNQEEAQAFLNVCLNTMREIPTYRLGQAIINELGDKTPTPNPEIFNSENEGKVYEWFYSNCVKNN